MNELRLLVHLAGEAALLLWGLHMVQSGVQRAFGSPVLVLEHPTAGVPMVALERPTTNDQRPTGDPC